MKISIVGIYKHDFASCPEELRQLQPGDMVWLQKEPENTYDPIAVRASVMGRFLGYAASVSRHELHAIMGQEDIIEASFCSLDEEHKGIEVEVEGECPAEPLAPSTLLNDWQPIGPVLHHTDQERDMRSHIKLMEAMARRSMQWDLNAEMILSSVLTDIPYILSGEDYCRLLSAIRLMRTHEGDTAEQWHEAAAMLSREMAKQGTPEQRALLYERVCRLAESPDMQRILSFDDDLLEKMLTDLPAAFSDFYAEQPEILVGRIRYANLPDDRLRPLLTRLCVYLFLRTDVEVNDNHNDNENENREPAATFPYFSGRAKDADKQDFEEQLRVYCTKDSAMGVCRFLRGAIRSGLIIDVFTMRKDLYDALIAFGFHGSYKTFANAVSKVLYEK